MPPDDKDAAVFPRKFNNRYAMIHRPISTGSSGAHIWLSFSPDLIHWGDHHVLLHARRGAWWDANKIGLSPPPLETPEGLVDLVSRRASHRRGMSLSTWFGVTRPGRSASRAAAQRRMGFCAGATLRTPGGRQRRRVSVWLGTG